MKKALEKLGLLTWTPPDMDYFRIQTIPVKAADYFSVTYLWSISKNGLTRATEMTF